MNIHDTHHAQQASLRAARTALANLGANIPIISMQRLPPGEAIQQTNLSQWHRGTITESITDPLYNMYRVDESPYHEQDCSMPSQGSPSPPRPSPMPLARQGSPPSHPWPMPPARAVVSPCHGDYVFWVHVPKTGTSFANVLM